MCIDPKMLKNVCAQRRISRMRHAVPHAGAHLQTATKTVWWREGKPSAPCAMRKYAIYPYMIAPLAPPASPLHWRSHLHVPQLHTSGTSAETNGFIWHVWKKTSISCLLWPNLKLCLVQCFESSGLFFQISVNSSKIKFFCQLQYSCCV